MMTTIRIPIRELHARTGHFVRKAAGDTCVIITDRGRAVAQLQALGSQEADGPNRPRWKNRVLLQGYAAVMNKKVPGDSTSFISEDRDEGGAA